MEAELSETAAPAKPAVAPPVTPGVVNEPRKAERRQAQRRQPKDIALSGPAKVLAETRTVVQTTPAIAPATLLPVTVPQDDMYADLIGQAVGLRLDAVSRDFGGEVFGAGFMKPIGSSDPG